MIWWVNSLALRRRHNEPTVRPSFLSQWKEGFAFSQMMIHTSSEQSSNHCVSIVSLLGQLNYVLKMNDIFKYMFYWAYLRVRLIDDLFCVANQVQKGWIDLVVSIIRIGICEVRLILIDMFGLNEITINKRILLNMYVYLDDFNAVLTFLSVLSAEGFSFSILVSNW